MTNESMTWRVVSFCAFLLRHHGQAFQVDRRTWPMQLRLQRDAFLRLGVELDVLELDLKLTVEELETAYEVLYNAPEHLARKKFAVVYHIDNFYVRVQKLMENLYRVLALSAGLDPDAKPKPNSSRRKDLSRGLENRRLEGLDVCVRDFEGKSEIREARNARNVFVHQYREESKWPTLGPAARLLEFEDTDKDQRLIRRETQPSEIDRYAARKAAEFEHIIELVRALRVSLFLQSYREAVSRLSRERSEVRRRWQWLVDFEAVWGDEDA